MYMRSRLKQASERKTLCKLRWDNMVCSVSGCVLLCSGTVSPSSSSAERASESSPILSGLYSYHIPTNTWTKLRDIQLEPQPKLGQSMIFHPVCMQRAVFTVLNTTKHHLCTDWGFCHVFTKIICEYYVELSRVLPRILWENPRLKCGWESCNSTVLDAWHMKCKAPE